MLDFTVSIAENRRRLGRPFLTAHRGVCGANVPCNTLASYQIALNQGADVVEIDVTKSKDGELFIFHPHMEKEFLGQDIHLEEMNGDEIRQLRLINMDKKPTSYPIPTLEEALMLLKDKVYINVDKFWSDVQGISAMIRKCGVEKQVIVKTFADNSCLDDLEKYAPDLMFMPIVHHTDEVSRLIEAKNINYIGTEVLFGTDEDEVISDEYIAAAHKAGRLIWANGIVYNEKANIQAGHTDDISAVGHPENGWGWLVKKKVDFIQTDWVLMARMYLESLKD